MTDIDDFNPLACDERPVNKWLAALNILTFPVVVPLGYLYLGWLLFTNQDDTRALRFIFWSWPK